MTHSNGKQSLFMNWMKLIRIPNLAIIVFTQYLLGYAVIRPMLATQRVESLLDHLHFFLLVLVTVMIAAGGYIINDHFDVNTDRRNRPGKNLLEGKLSVRKALRLYYVINGLALIMGFYLAYHAGSMQLGLIFPAIAGLLWFYSSRYQRMIVWGNLIVAVLTAMVILIIWLFDFFMLVSSTDDFVNAVNQLRSISTFVWAYALFAFLLSFIREIIKDIQDMKGDMETGYRTLPVIWGITRASSIVAGMVVILIALIAASQWYLFNRDLMLVFWYLLIVVQALLVYLFIQLLTHKETGDYGFLSSTAKIIMVAGILSMELIYISM